MASGDFLAVIDPREISRNSVDSAALGQVNGHPIATFRNGFVDRAFYSAIIPNSYTRGGITLTLLYTCTTNSGNIRWHIHGEENVEAFSSIDTENFPAQHLVTTPVPGTVGQLQQQVINLPEANAQTPEPGEFYRLQILRNSTDPLDTCNGHIQLIRLIISET